MGATPEGLVVERSSHGRLQRTHPRGPAQGEPPFRASEGVRPEGARLERVGLPQGRPQLREVLGGLREGARLVQALEEGPRLEAAQGEVVRRRQAERLGQLRGPAPRGRAAQQGRAHLGRRAGRPAHADVPRSLPRGRQVRQRPAQARREEGRPGHALPSDDPGAADRDARVRADRRDPLGRLRRIFGRVAARSHQRPGREGARDGRRRLAARQRRAAQADRGRGRRGDADDRERRGRAPNGHAHPLRREARALVAPADGRRADRLQAGEDGCGGSALHPLYLGHDGQAEGDPAHDRRIPGGRVRDLAVDLRPQGGGRLLVHGRHRLGDGPLLRRLRAARQRRDVPDVRRARPTRPRAAASGTSSSGTASPSSTRRRRPSARS